MREIRFRAWYAREAGGLMQYRNEAPGWGSEQVLLCPFTGKVFGAEWGEGMDGTAEIVVREIERPILMQFTGLKDKDGRDIYEGDIVRVEDYSNGFVEWDHEDGAWRLCLAGDAWYILGDTWAQSLREVVGNIYENEELIP